jgi:hypothetical protein
MIFFIDNGTHPKSFPLNGYYILLGQVEVSANAWGLNINFYYVSKVLSVSDRF